MGKGKEGEGEGEGRREGGGGSAYAQYANFHASTDVLGHLEKEPHLRKLMR